MSDMFKAIFGAFAAPIFFILGVFVVFYVFGVMGVDVGRMFAIMIALSPIWLPLALFFITYERWNWFVQLKFAVEHGRTTLRIKLPQEVFKSPEAMDNVLTQLHNKFTITNLMESYLDGKHPLVSSLELVSYGGEIRFYMNVPKKRVKDLIESQLYAQYPGIEVVEEPIDYAAEVKWDDLKTWDMMSFHIVKTEPDIFPIKTYIDVGMDRLPKEEEKIDPIAPMLEFLGKAKPHERIWIQFLARPHVKKNFQSFSLKEVPTWDKAAQKKINEMLNRNERHLSSEEETEIRPALTSGERDLIGHIERNTSKYAFEVAIRAMYIAPPDNFNGEMIGQLIKSFSQYDMIGRNSLGVRWRTDFDYNFISDPKGKRKIRYKKQELEDYKKRYYYPGDVKTWADKPKVMSTEELATMWHIPGRVVITPSLTRVESNKREAPSNLPIGVPTHQKHD